MTLPWEGHAEKQFQKLMEKCEHHFECDCDKCEVLRFTLSQRPSEAQFDDYE